MKRAHCICLLTVVSGSAVVAQGGESRGLLAGSAVSVSANPITSQPLCDEALYEYPNFDLQGSSFTLAYQSDRYTLVPGAGIWIPPTGGQNFGDDTEADITLPFNLPYPDLQQRLRDDRLVAGRQQLHADGRQVLAARDVVRAVAGPEPIERRGCLH